jgi:virginiamycin B lyase
VSKRRFGTLAAAVAATVLLQPASASAAPAVNGVYDLSGSPAHLTAGPDGNIWATLSGSSLGNDLARITPQGTVTEFNPTDVTSPVGIAAGDDGNLWVTQAGGVAKVPPADPDSATKSAIVAIADPRGITAGPDGNLWAASGDKVLRIPPGDPANPTEFTIAGLGARGISAGPSLIWVVDFGGGRIISLNTDGTGVTPYTVGGGPQEVAASSGAQVAYGNPGSDPQTIGRITPGGAPLTTPTPPVDPFGVAFGADGAYWFAQFAAGNLGRLTTAGSYTTLGGLPAASGPRYLTAGPANTLWVGLETSQQVARVTGLEPPAPPAPKAPETKITKKPGQKIKAGRRRAKAKIKFRSTPTGGAFECSLKKKGKRDNRERKLAKFRSCKSPKAYKRLRRGRYEFRVRATISGATDPTPAKAKFRVRR